MKHFTTWTGLVLAVLMLCISGCMRSEADADHTAALQAYIAELEVIHTAEGHFFSQNAAADVSVRVGALAEDGRQAEAFLCVTDARTPLLLSLGLFDRHVVSSGSLYTASLGCVLTTLRYNAQTAAFEVTQAQYVSDGYFSWDSLLPGGSAVCVYQDGT